MQKSNGFGKFMYYSTTGQNLMVLLLISARKIDLRSQTGSASCCNVNNVYLKSIMKTIHSAGHTLTLRRLMSYIYGAPILDVSRSHTTTQHSR